MSFTPDTSITGGAYTGGTSPTFTLAGDTPPERNALQWVVTALGGTQTGVTANSASSPFTVSFWKPANIRPLPAANPLSGLRGSVPMNVYKMVVRKGGLAAVNTPAIALFRGTWEIPAGMDSYAPQEILAMQSFIEGLFTEEGGASGIGQVLITNVVG